MQDQIGSPPPESNLFDISDSVKDIDAKRLRERYIASRFPQFAGNTSQLRNTGEILRAARHLLDDGRPNLAEELLCIALQEEPYQREAWLFLIEVAFLNHDAARFDLLADNFRKLFPESEDQYVIDAMAHDLNPHDPRYGYMSSATPLPNWSGLSSLARDENRQRRYHQALVSTTNCFSEN
jgi:hypothetical protein